MSSENTSSNIEDKFSKININNASLKSGEIPVLRPRGPKKTYPRHVYPSGVQNKVTPCSPYLSTAMRAEHRVSSSKNASNPKTPLRMISGEVKSQTTVTRPNDKRIISCPMSERSIRSSGSTDQLFSFMKETTSSLQKKQSNPFYSSPTISSPGHPSQKSHNLVKKRLDNTNELHYSLRGRRVASSTLSAYTGSRPTDITNLMYKKPENYSKIDGMQEEVDDSIAESPTKPKIRHVSQPILKESVYDRLYNESYKIKPCIESKAITRANPRQGSAQIPSQVTQQENQLKRKRQIPEQNYNEPRIKINTLHSLYKILYDKDPTIFEDCNEGDFKCNSLRDPQKIMEDRSSSSENSLNIYERGEILRNKELYFISKNSNTNKLVSIKNYSENFGFDDKDGNYIIVPHDHISYRYEIESILGCGSFGDVVKCKDHKYSDTKKNKLVAIKIIKNDLKWSLQAIYEIKMLKFLSDKSGSNTILKYYDHFHFRGHMCIVTELLSINLYTILELTDFVGLSLNLLKTFSKKILHGLNFIHKNNILHCDIKPENIMIKVPPNFTSLDSLEDETLEIKIIDFGSSCFQKEISYTYIQSRFYRAPEIILGAKYNEKIDIWSFGCLLTELYSGDPLLPGKNEFEQIGLTLEMFGPPSSALILNSRKKLLSNQPIDEFSIYNSMNGPPILKNNDRSIKKTLLYTLFDANGKLNLRVLNFKIANSKTSIIRKQIKPSSRNIEVALRLQNDQYKSNISCFLDFLKLIFMWDPAERNSANQLLAHNFLKD